MAFSIAQTFYIDKSTVRNAEQITLTSIDMFFKAKPLRSGNSSGIVAPGVSIFLCETRDDDVPDTTRLLETGFTRLEYDSIVASSDASIATKFNFVKPVIISTNKSYAILVSYDGNEDYSIWTCREGENVVGTNVVTGGATAKNLGKVFEYSSLVNSSSNAGTTIQEQWKPLNDVDIKFKLFCGVYGTDGAAANSVLTTYLMPSDPVEYILFDRYHFNTSKWANAVIGELVFQETPVIYGPISVSANSLTITAGSNSINFSTLLEASAADGTVTTSNSPEVYQKKYIVIRNGSDQSANVNIREVRDIISNTQITIDRFPTFTSNYATFSSTAVGKLTQNSIHWYTGRWWNSTTNVMDTFVGRKTDILRLSETNANSTVRFVNNMVESITINSGGIGYSNSDVITVYPAVNSNTANSNHIRYMQSYANAIANVVTNSAGTITGIAIRDAGYGLISNATLSIATTGGTTANLSVTVGSKIRGEQSNAIFANTVVTNVEIHRAYPHMGIAGNQHHDYKLYQHYAYYITPGKEHILKASTPAFKREIETFTNINTSDLAATDGRNYVIASTSNEAIMPANVSVVTANGATVQTLVKSSSIIEMDITSNNAFTLPLVVSDDVYNYKYIINNDSTDEHKGNGSALCRHVSKKVTFADNRNAEDIIVYLDAHRPSGTNIKVYARIHNKSDDEAFDDKDWTELALRSNNANKTSSITDDKNLIEFSYGLPSSPTSVSTIAGSAQLADSQANVVGIGTSWATSLAVNDVVKIYSKLFPDNYMVSVVRSISNNTFLTLDDVVTDTSLTSGTMAIDLVGRPGYTELGRPHSAWSNKSNSYVCRYYDANMSKHDTFSSFAIKIVLLSENLSIIPKIENIRAVGVSA
jgi:hypothetical protein